LLALVKKFIDSGGPASRLSSHLEAATNTRFSVPQVITFAVNVEAKMSDDEMLDASAAQTPGEEENPDAGVEDNLAGRIRMVWKMLTTVNMNRC
jgi:hypothetical protein